MESIRLGMWTSVLLMGAILAAGGSEAQGAPRCRDNDGDGAGPNCPIPDCNDSDPTIYLNAPELCDNKDNNCDSLVDNGVVGTGGSCDTGQAGVCATGTTQCVSASLQCVRNTSPSGEICDARDNDCNGLIDDGPGPDADGFTAFCDCNDGDPSWNPLARDI